MMGEGFELMVYGMGMVFSFLVLLVVFMTMAGAFFRKFSEKFPEPEPAPKTVGGGMTRKPAAGTSAKVAVAVAAAYRARKGA